MEEEMFWVEGVIIGALEDLGDGGFAGDTSERGRTEEALWIEGVAAVSCAFGGLGSGSGEARASRRRGFDDFLCLDLGEG